MFLFFPVLCPGGCEPTWVAGLTVVVAMCSVYCCYTVVGSFGILCVAGSVTVLYVFTARQLLCC